MVSKRNIIEDIGDPGNKEFGKILDLKMYISK